MARFRFVVLGAGFFAGKWMETVKAREDCEVVGIASRPGAWRRSYSATWV